MSHRDPTLDDPLSASGLRHEASALAEDAPGAARGALSTLDTTPSATLPEAEASLFVQGVSVPWTVRDATVEESLDAPFEAAVEVVTAHELPTRELPGRAALLRVCRDDRAQRDVAGVVRRVEDLGSFDGRHRIRVTVVPHLWLLSLRTDCRIFQDKTACEIVDAVLDAANLYRGPEQRSWTRVRRAQLLRREYCVQYRERDLDFIARLLQEEGIAYLVEADSARGERVVFFDTLASADAAPLFEGDALAVRGAESKTAHDESIRHLTWSDSLQSRTVTLRDYNFTRPHGVDAMTFARPAQGHEPAVYDFPGRFTLAGDGTDPRQHHAYELSHDDGARRAEVRLQELDAEAHRGAGVANAIGFAPGRRFRVVDHGRAELDGREFVLVRVHHTFRASEATRTKLDAHRHDGESARTEGYLNRFECVAATVAYRPQRVTARPTIQSAQTAVVVTPEGEDVHVDTHGRVKVRFHWDRAQGVSDEHRSSWIRVSQPWAGAQWGFSFVPRKGMEVVVQFLEGDPDRPLITGSVYNGANRTSYPLDEARNRTRSWIRTRSTPGDDAGRYNELRFDDLRDHEEVAIRAQRDLNEQVLHDHALSVGRQETNTIGGNQKNSVGGNRTSTVARNEKLTVHEGRELTVAHNDAVVIGESQTTLVNMGEGARWESAPPPGAALKVRGEWNVEVTERIVLKVGASALTIEPNGITLTTGELTAHSQYLALNGTRDVSVVGDVIALTGGQSVELKGEEVDVRGRRDVVIGSRGTVSVKGTPLLLNGPGFFAGRVTEAAPDAIATGAALVLIGGPSFEFPVSRRASDGALLVGRNIVVRAGETADGYFQSHVMRDLGIMASTPHGLARLRNIDNNPHGHTVTIREYVSADADSLDSNGLPFGWNNSTTHPLSDGYAIRRDAQNNPVPNTGSSSEIAYNPDVNLGVVGHPEPHDATLFHELGHAEHNAYGVNRTSDALDHGWHNREERQTIEDGINRPGAGNDIPGAPHSPSENEYLGDREYPFRRTDHGQGFARPDGTAI
ncbi:MAG: type VI secretion system tip protein TssI/VgrG [Polyangiales bacterium]